MLPALNAEIVFLKKNGVFEEIKLILRSQLSQYFWSVLMIVKSAFGFENDLKISRDCGTTVQLFRRFHFNANSLFSKILFFLSNYKKKLDLDLSVILSL